MAISVTLRISGIDFDSDAVALTLGTKFPTLLWRGEKNNTTATFYVDEGSAVTEVFDIARAIETSLAGVKVERVDRDLVSVTDIAVRVGISREGARKWTKDSTFPSQFATASDRMGLWIWASVVDWLKSARGIDMGESLPNEALLTQIDNCLHRNPDATTVQWKQLSNHTPTAERSSESKSEWMSMRSVKPSTPVKQLAFTGR